MADGMVSAWISSTDDDVGAVIARAHDGTHYYRFAVDEQRSVARIVKRGNVGYIVLGEIAYNIDWGPGHTIGLIAAGSWLYGTVDGKIIMSAYDGVYEYMDGYAGMVAGGLGGTGHTTTFDNFFVDNWWWS